MIVSSIKDDLEMLFSEDYQISDSNYKVLSEILLSNDVVTKAFDGGLVQLIKLLFEDNVYFPISVNTLRHYWDKKYLEFNFVKMLSSMISSGILRLRKSNKDVFLNSTTITKDLSVEDLNKEKFAVLYVTPKFTDIYDGFLGVLLDSKRVENTITEGAKIAPVKIESVIDKANDLLKNLGISISIESYMKDTSMDTEETNLIISGTSPYTIKDKDIQRMAKRVISKLDYVSSVEAYKESDSELFLSIITKVSGTYRNLHKSIFEFIKELEVEGV